MRLTEMTNWGLAVRVRMVAFHFFHGRLQDFFYGVFHLWGEAYKVISGRGH